MTEPTTYRLRFRFRVLTPLTVKDSEIKFQIAGRDAVLTPMIPNTPIRDSNWLIVTVRGFPTDAEARDFAIRLKAVTAFAAVGVRLGVDVGMDLPTSGVGRSVAEQVQKETGIILRSNVHGIDVFLDDPNIRFSVIQATGTVTHAPHPFLDDITTLFDASAGASQIAKDVVLLLNFALMRPEPVAQIIFAISAVEMLGQMERWSPAQKQLLERLAISAESDSSIPENERIEIAEAIRRGLQKIGLRQGVMRLLDRLDLEHLKGKWDEIYRKRSKLVHGLAPTPGADYSQLAFDTITVCGQILLKVVAADVPMIDRHVKTSYG